MANNPFRKPYVFSKKWAIWDAIIIPFGIYANLKPTGETFGSFVTNAITIIWTFVIIPWVIMRVWRAKRGRTPQGKYYEMSDSAISHAILELPSGKKPRTTTQLTLDNGVLVISGASVNLAEIKSARIGDPRSRLKIPFKVMTWSGLLGSLYFIMQPLILILYLDYVPAIAASFSNHSPASRERDYEILHTHAPFSVFVHSQALLVPALKAVGVMVALQLILRVLKFQLAFVIETTTGKVLFVPFRIPRNPFKNRKLNISLKKFIKKVKIAMKSARQNQKSES
jgi:hypothetical protein